MSTPRIAVGNIIRTHPGLTLTELGRLVNTSRPRLAEGLSLALDRGEITTRPTTPGSHHACTYWPPEAR